LKDEDEIRVDEKAKLIADLLKDDKGKSDMHTGQILVKALASIKEGGGMVNYHLEDMDRHARAVGFESRMHFFDKLFDWLHENKHNQENPHTSEHDFAWVHSYSGEDSPFHTKGDSRKVIVISNMMGGASHFFVKDEHIIGDEDWSTYYIVRIWDDPERFFREDSKRKSLRTLVKNGKLTYFNDQYADGDRKKSWQQYAEEGYSPKMYEHDYERCILKYDCHRPESITRHYFTLGRHCENALMQLESAFWMRTE
jgi:hypothetical protein